MKQLSRRFAVFVLLAGVAVILGARLRLHAKDADTSKPLALEGKPKTGAFSFVAYGDIRFHDPEDRGPSDPDRRQAIVKQITSDHPDFVLINGDLVLDGEDPSDWKIFDRETQQLRAVGVQVYPALGNHDVRGGDEALHNYFQRFPDLQQHRWYSLKYANCLFLILDSDTDHSPLSEQGKWLENELDTVPGDVDFVFLAMHHPPYTRSSDHLLGGGHSARSEEQHLAKLLESKQPQMHAKLIAIAGHVHNYERYEHSGVTYIVSGGGGATPYLFRRQPNDFYREPGPTYHYCTFKVAGDKLSFEMHKLTLDSGKPVFRVADKFDLSANKK